MNLKTFLALVESPRKRRLAACAFARSVWPILVDPRSRKAVEVAERSADGLATDKQLQEAWGIIRLEQCSEYRGVDIAALASRGYSGNPIAWKNQLVQWLTNTPQCPHEQILDDLTGPTRGCEECEECEGDGKTKWTTGTTPDDCYPCHDSSRVLQPQTLCGGETQRNEKLSRKVRHWLFFQRKLRRLQPHPCLERCHRSPRRFGDIPRPRLRPDADTGRRAGRGGYSFNGEM